MFFHRRKNKALSSCSRGVSEAPRDVFFRALFVRVGENLFGRSELFDSPLVEESRKVADTRRLLHIVGNDNDRELLLQAQAKLEKAKADAEAQIEVARAEATAVKLKSVEVARALGFTINETEIKDEEGVVTSIEYEIDFEGKTSDEIQLITEYLKYIEYLAKWNGELPGVVTGDSASIMIPTNPTENNG